MDVRAAKVHLQLKCWTQSDMAGMEEVLWVPFEQRPEWQGFSVRLGPAQSTPVVEISYSDQDAETLAYFYTVLEDGEKSLRALQLTKEVPPSVRLLQPAAGHCGRARPFTIPSWASASSSLSCVAFIPACKLFALTPTRAREQCRSST